MNAIIIRMCARFVKECNWRGFENPGGFGLEAWLHDHGAVDLKGCPRGRAQVSLVSAAVLVTEVVEVLAKSVPVTGRELPSFTVPNVEVPVAASIDPVTVPVPSPLKTWMVLLPDVFTLRKRL